MEELKKQKTEDLVGFTIGLIVFYGTMISIGGWYDAEFLIFTLLACSAIIGIPGLLIGLIFSDVKKGLNGVGWLFVVLSVMSILGRQIAES